MAVIVTAGAVAVPVPARVTVCDPEPALSLMTSDAVRDPSAVGVKVTPIVHVEPGATEALAQLFVEIAKSPALAPPRVVVPIASAAVPLLETVTV